MFSGKTRKNRIIIPAALVASAGAMAANAATIVWNGSAADLNWNTLTNWSTGALPSDIAQFQENGYNSGDTVTVATDQTVNRLAFNFSSTNAASKDITLTGAPITLTGLAANSNGFNRANTVSGIQTINNNILLGGSQKWNIAGNTSAASGVGRLIVNGVIGETAGGSKDLTKDGNTNLELNGNNTFTGVTTIIQNTIVVGNANTLGLGTSAVLVGDTAVNTSQSNLVTKTGVTFGRDIEVRSGQTGGSRLGGADGLGLTAWNGTISLEKDVLLTGGIGLATGTAEFRGNLVDGSNAFVSSNVTKQNGGVVKLSGAANTYSGTTAINAGTLLVNGVLSNNDATVSAINTSRLGGLGTINRPVHIAGGAILSPGDGGAGLLTVGGGKTLALDDGAVLEWEAGATAGASDLVVTSAVSFGSGAALKILSGPYLPDPNASYVLLSWTGDDPSTLANWSVDPSSAWTGSISYVNAADGLPGGEVVLSNAVAAQTPEPSTCVSLAAVTGLVVSRRRRKR